MTSAPASTAAAPPPASVGFEAGVLEFAGRLRAFIRKRVADPNDAEDITQEVFLKVFRARGTLRDPGKLNAWLYQTARGTIIDYYRRRRPSEELAETTPAEPGELDEVGARLRRSVRRFLTTLPEAYRQPLELAELEGLSIAAIATRMRLSETAVKSRLARGRAQLRQKLLDCCQFEFDTFGKVIDLHQRNACACDGTPTCGPAAEVEGRTHSLPPHLAIGLAVDEDEPAIRALLAPAGLPVEDLTARHILNFVTAKTGDQLVGCAGIELHATAGLLRSVAVAAGLRGLGVGVRLVAAAETLAAQLGLRELYLLTTTAPAFFERRGYERIARGDAPPAIRASREFASLCPASAIVMHKALKAQPVTAGCC